MSINFTMFAQNSKVLMQPVHWRDNESVAGMILNTDITLRHFIEDIS